MSKKRKFKNIKGFSIQFLPFSEIKNLGSEERVSKILRIVRDKILILQGRINAEEETRLIERSMQMIGKNNNFKGIELAVISSDGKKGFFGKMKKGIVNALSGGELSAISIIGPATIVKDIKRNPKKLELLLNK